MSVSIKVSELTVLSEITTDDYIIVNDSGSTSTKRATFNTLSTWMTGSDRKVGSSSYSNYAFSASYAKSASWSDRSGYSLAGLTASYASRSAYATYVTPLEQLTENEVNLTGTASWAVSASNLPVKALFPITASNASTASYLFLNPNWNSTGETNGTASYALSASLADVALNVVGGGGISGTSNQYYITKWTATGANQPIQSTRIWENDSYFTIFGATNDVENANLFSIYEAPVYYSTIPTKYLSIFKGGSILMTGSAALTPKGESNRLVFGDYDSTNASMIYFSSSIVDPTTNPSSNQDGALIFENYVHGTEPWIFRNVDNSDPRVRRDNVIIRPDGANNTTYVDISGSLWAQGYLGVGNLSSRVGQNARLHVSSSTSDTYMFIAESNDYIGLVVDQFGKVGIGTTNPTARLETIGSFASPEYYVKSGATYYKGLSGTYIAFDLTNPQGDIYRTYLQFSNGLLIGVSTAASRLKGTESEVGVTVPTTTTDTTTPSAGGGGCPSLWQMMLTQEYNWIRADELKPGMHIPGINKPWVVINKTKICPAPIWRCVINKDCVYDIDENHKWKMSDGSWKQVKDIKVGEKISKLNGEPDPVTEVRFLVHSYKVQLEVEGHEYTMSDYIAHNSGEIQTRIRN